MLIDPNSHEQTALSGRGWPGTRQPADVGLSPWQLVLRFGPHLPGGGWGEPDAATLKASAEKARWTISGPLEIDCMICHCADASHDPAELSRQIEEQNFKWAATAALGLAVVRGAARKIPDDWDPLMPPSPDYPDAAAPTLVWDKARFDPDNRVLFPITRRPANERCYFCHSFREVGPDAPQTHDLGRDVHLAAGLLCVDCHRHGLDHMTTRGYGDEADERANPALMSLSCEGCHLGQALRDVAGTRDDPANAHSVESLGGRYGAPHPQHSGLPPVHFEKLTCTACHAGPWVGTNPRRVQTALAHDLGLASRERGAHDAPLILEPIYARQADGRVGPHRTVATGAGGAETYLWPIAHDVRPAAQSLGVGGCTECHTREGAAGLYFGATAWPHVRPDEIAPRLPATMLDVWSDEPRLANAWDVGFRFRGAFKWYGYVCAALVALVLLRTGFTPQSPGGAPRGRRRWIMLVLGLGLLGLVAEALTGLGAKWVLGGIDGWPLVLHAVAAPLFMLGIVTAALSAQCWLGRGGLVDGLFWLALLLAFVSMTTMLVAMTPLPGYAGQVLLRELHVYAGIGLCAAVILYWLVAIARRRAGT